MMASEMWNALRIAVVVPARNERQHVRGVLLGIPDWVDSIVVVDDGSTDGTAEAVASATDARVTLVRHGTSAGVGAAIVAGYERAIADGADVFVVMAGDGQMDPADLPALLAPILAGDADYVKGNRFRHVERRNMPVARRIAGKLLGAATRVVTGYPIDDSQCGYTALTSAAARALPLRDLWPKYGYPNDLLALLSQAGLRVAEVPVRPIYAGQKSGVRPWHAVLILALLTRRALDRRFKSAPTQNSLATMAGFMATMAKK